MAELRLCQRQPSCAVVGARHIGVHVHCLPAGIADRVDGLPSALVVAVHDHDGCPFSREEDRRFSPDTAARARDERDFALEPSRHS